MPKVKKIAPHKVKKPTHPNSRKATQLMREAHRKERLDKRKAQRQLKVSNQVVKLMWFREHIDEGKSFYSYDEMLELIERYLHRLDDELEKLEDLQGEKRHIRSHYRLQHASKEDTIRSIIVKERGLFEGPGFEAPDLTNLKFFKTFLEWNGEEHLLSRIKLRKYTVSREHLSHAEVCA